MKVKLKENKYNIIFAAQCLLIFVLSLFFVPQCDDLIFKYVFPYNNINEFLNQVFYYGNGRLLGNAFALFFSNHMQLFYLIEIALVAVFAIFIEKLTELKNSKIFVLAAITAVPLWNFKELLPWMSAFANYFVPIVLFLLSILIIKNNYCSKNRFYIIILIIIGFSEQLFVELNTIINIIFALMLFIYFIKIKSLNVKETAVLLAANALGAFVMFGYKIYINYSETYIFKTIPQYRKNILSFIELDGIKGGIVFMIQNIKCFVLTVVSQVLLIGVLLAVMIYIEKRADKKEVKRKPLFAAAVISYAVLFGITVCNFVVYNNDIPNNNILFAALLFFVAVTFVLIAFLFIKTILKRMDKKQKIKISFLVFFALLSFAPFLLVAPYSYRGAFLSVLFVMFAVIEVMKFANEEYGFKIEKVYDTVFIIMCIAMVIYIGLYANEKKVFNYKEKYYKSSYYLPESNQRVLIMTPDSVWIRYSGEEHEFVPVNEFETYITESNKE